MCGPKPQVIIPYTISQYITSTGFKRNHSSLSFHQQVITPVFGATILYTVIPCLLSGRRGSNPQPQPRQGRTLPIELLPQLYFTQLSRTTVDDAQNIKVQDLEQVTGFEPAM